MKCQVQENVPPPPPAPRNSQAPTQGPLVANSLTVSCLMISSLSFKRVCRRPMSCTSSGLDAPFPGFSPESFSLFQADMQLAPHCDYSTTSRGKGDNVVGTPLVVSLASNSLSAQKGKLRPRGLV